MLKKTITFDDLDGNSVTEDFYFHFNKTELIELQLADGAGFLGRVEEAQAKVTILEKQSVDGKDIRLNDLAPLIEIMKDMIVAAVGKRSEDGKRFMKSSEITNEFIQTEAYSELFMELATDMEAGAAFINGLMPRGLVTTVSDITAKETVNKDIIAMSREELIEMMKSRNAP